MALNCILVILQQNPSESDVHSIISIALMSSSAFSSWGNYSSLWVWVFFLARDAMCECNATLNLQWVGVWLPKNQELKSFLLVTNNMSGP